MPTANGESENIFRVLLGVKAVHYGLDLVTAALIVTGQLRPSGVFVVPEGSLISFTGPVLGGPVMKGIDMNASFIMTGLEVVTAVLLIAKVFSTTGVYITSGRASIVVAGLPLGAAASIANVPGVKPGVLNQYERLLMKYYGLKRVKQGLRG